MFKMIFLLAGLLAGVGGGVYWAHHNPDAAAKLSAQEEKKFLEYQLALNQKIQGKLEQLQGKASGKSAGSSFLGSGQSGLAWPASVSLPAYEPSRQRMSAGSRGAAGAARRARSPGRRAHPLTLRLATHGSVDGPRRRRTIEGASTTSHADIRWLPRFPAAEHA